jgi:hypothetical protein
VPDLDLKLLYRFGFICHRQGEELAGDDIWHAIAKDWFLRDYGGFVVWFHPETPLTVSRSDERFAVVIGDAIGVGTRAGRVLAADAADATNAELPGILYDYTGRFALLVIEGDQASIFHDPIGSRSVFYTLTGQLAVASHAALLARAQSRALRDDMATLVASEPFKMRRPAYLPADGTLHEGVYHLIPNNFFDLGLRRSVRYWPSQRRVEYGFDDLAAEFDEYFRCLSAFLGTKTPITSITGGIDARTIIAGLQHYNTTLRGVTWLRYNFKEYERPVIDQVKDVTGMDHRFIDEEEYPPTRLSRTARENAGEFRPNSSVVAGMHAVYGALEAPVFVRGYGGEIIRAFNYRTRNTMRGMSTRDMTKAYMMGTRRQHLDVETFREAVFTCFEDYGRRVSPADWEGMDFNANDIFYWEHRMGTWGAIMMNEMDAALYSMTGLNSRRIFEMALGLPDDVRFPEARPKELMRRVVERYNPKLGRVPHTEGAWGKRNRQHKDGDHARSRKP